MISLRRRVTVVAASASLLALPLAAVATPAHADTQCNITGFTPTTVEVGLSPVKASFKPKVSGCTLESWSIEAEDSLFFVFDGASNEVFEPYSNSDAGRYDAAVSAYNGDYEESVEVLNDAFSLKRNTTWDKVNASPEPVRKGSKITIKARLRIADWENQEYDGFTNRAIDLESRSPSGSYTKVKTVTSGSGGYVTAIVTASSDRCFRFRYGGNSYAGGGASTGDCVDVR